MKRDLTALAQAFLGATAAPCLDEAAVVRGLAAVFAADRARTHRPFVSDLRTRRIENVAGPVFARAERELQVTRDELAGPSCARWLTPKRDQVVLWLLEAKLSVHVVAALVNRDRAQVRAAARRARARVAAVGALAKALPAVAVVTAEQRRASHG